MQRTTLRARKIVAFLNAGLNERFRDLSVRRR
jgi:hypothetical protein